MSKDGMRSRLFPAAEAPAGCRAAIAYVSIESPSQEAMHAS
jgi:hypothetical protein